MSLVNNYLKRLGRLRGAKAKRGGGSLPPSLNRMQEESGKIKSRRKGIVFVGLVVGVSFLGFTIISLVSLLTYPSVNESIAVEVMPKTQVEETLAVAGTNTTLSPAGEKEDQGLEVEATEDFKAQNASADGRVSREQQVAALQSISGIADKGVVPQKVKPEETELQRGAIYEPQPITASWQIQKGDQINHTPSGKKSTSKIVIKESVYTPAYLYQLAIQAQKSHKLARAERYYKMVLSEKPRHEDCLINLAAIYIQEQRFGEAQALLEKVVDINPENAKALVNVGVIELKMKKKEAAREYFLRALKYNPSEKTALVNLAYLAKLDHQHEEATRYFQKLIMIEPGNCEILLAYAGIEEKRKEYRSAMILYRKCLNQMTMQDNPEKYEALSSRIQILRRYAQTNSL